MKRTILCWLCSAVPLFAGTSWPHVDYKEVRAFAWAEPMEQAFVSGIFSEASCRMLSTVTLFSGVPSPGIPLKRTAVFGLVFDFSTPPSEELIRADMTFVDGVINKDGALLNGQQVKRLLKAESRRYRPRGVAACYEPHNAFVFYDAEKKPVAFLEVCFDCLGARVSPSDSGCDPDYYALALLCAELRLPIGSNKSAKKVRDHLEYTINLAKTPSPRKRRPTPGNSSQEDGR